MDSFTLLLHAFAFMSMNDEQGYVIRLPEFTFPCCGVVYQWRILFAMAGDLEMQVWRTFGPFDHQQLIGENILKATNVTGTELLFRINVTEQVSVIPADAIGWRTAGAEVRYDATSTLDHLILSEDSMPDVNIGDVHVFSHDSIKNRMYAVRADLAPGTAPVWTNLPGNVVISDTLYPGALVFTPLYIDNNTRDTHNFTHVGNLPSYFTIDPKTGVVKVAKELVPAKFKIYMVVTDTCGLQDILPLTVTVTGINQPPKLENLPGIANIHEDTITETLVYNLTVTDNDYVSCILAESIPSDAPFLLKIQRVSSVFVIDGYEYNWASSNNLGDPASITVVYVRNFTSYYANEFGVYLKSGANISYQSETTYMLNVTCSDNIDWSSGIIYVYVLPNVPPIFTNLPGNITISAPSTTVGSPFYGVIAKDEDDTLLTYQMTCTPSPCPFNISDSGMVFTDKSLLQETHGIFVLYVRVSDGKHVAGPAILNIEIRDRNSLPIFSSLPSTIFVSEHASAVSILNFTVSDDDTADTVGCFFDVQPTRGFLLFEFNTSTFSFYIKPGAVLDYETISSHSFNVTFAATDNIDFVYKSVLIYIQDANDQPQFLTLTFYVWTYESVAKTYISESPAFTDQDASDTVIYRMKNGSGIGYVQINQTSGIMSFAVDYDIDQASMPLQINVDIEIEDSGGLKDMCSVIIYIRDINDNAPTFNATSYVFTFSLHSTIGSFIGVVCATDADTTTTCANLITYRIYETSPFKDLFAISSFGMIFAIGNFSNLTSGQLITFPVQATDNCSPKLSSEVYVTIIIASSNFSKSNTLIGTATETGNFKMPVEWAIISVMAAAGLLSLLAVIGLICIYRQNVKSKDIQRRDAETEKRPKPTFHRMKSTVFVHDAQGLLRKESDGNVHPPVSRALSRNRLTRNILPYGKSGVSDLRSTGNEVCNNEPRLFTMSGLQGSRGKEKPKEKTSLNF